MRERGKRGISSIIVTIVLIGLALAAIVIVWTVIRGLLSQGVNVLGLGKFTIGLQIDGAHTSGNDSVVDVTRKAGEGNVSGIIFVISNATEKKTITQGGALNQLETKSFTLNLSEINIVNITQVSIAPVFASATGNPTIGDILDTYKFQTGVSGTGGTNPGGGNNNPPPGGGTGCSPACVAPKVCDSFSLKCVDCLQDADCASQGQGYTCNNGVCKSSTCVPSGNPCGTWQCGTQYDNCGNPYNCGPSNGNCPNPSSQLCSNGICTDIVPIKTGSVQDSWPIGINMYFSSQSLYSDTNFEGDYMTFNKGTAQGTDSGCLLIIKHQSFSDPTKQIKSFVGFNFETTIQTGNTFNIWTPAQRPQICT